MLGCHDFCGYYEWTFHFVHRRWGAGALASLWAEAIGGESQQHYAQAARREGLAGLYRAWVKTGEEEVCDWTFTLDQARNLLRCDMRQCPSKGFLLANDRNADEDYCDHCMGWMIPLLAEVGIEVWEHEHNHVGQCWSVIRPVGQPEQQDVAPGSEPPWAGVDIRRDRSWNCGYLDRWEHNRKQPLAPALSEASDPCQVLADWFADAKRLWIVETAVPQPPWRGEAGKPAGLLTLQAYLRGGDEGIGRAAVLIGHEDVDLAALAERFGQTPEPLRPLLLHPYLPGRTLVDFPAHGLPRPLPLLPLLIRTGQYVHRPGGPAPDNVALLAALARALGKPLVMAGRQQTS